MQINCFGDSLTAGTAWGNTMPYSVVLERLTGIKTNNYGIGGESSFTVASRIGAMKVTLMADAVFDKDEKSVPVALGDIFMQPTRLLCQVKEDDGDDLVNPVKLGDCEGTLNRSNGVLYFTRKNAGRPEVIPKGSCLVTRLSHNDFSQDINIFWVGTNDYASTDNVCAVIANIKSMIQRTAGQRYIVIGMTAKSYMPEIEAVNEMLADEFKEHFYDFRKYILSLPVTDETDARDAADGEIPGSYMKALQYDHVHGNEKFFGLLGAQLYNKIKELGYLKIT
ncbi:MAG: SGNH/GDSL hydrolase family protein [Lachnospiraceae bacterium]|nr:SGNH/GDSL hydrolase family protein [Lachnospiraceae bacterium]